MNFVRSLFGRLLGLSLLAWGVAGAHAAEDDATEADKPRAQVDLVGAVNLSPSTVWETLRATSAARREELRVRPPRMMGEALDAEDGVVVQKPSYNVALPSIRGLGDSRVLVLVDGIRLNVTTTSSLPSGLGNLNLVDPYLLESVEVVRGPGLSSYGSDGLGGTIALKTRRPIAIAGSNLEVNAGSRLSYASYDQSFSGSLSGGGRWGRFAGEIAFSARHFGELVGGNRVQAVPLTAYSDGGLYMGFGADLGRGHLAFVYQGGRQYDGLRSERSRADDLFLLNEVARDLVYLRYTSSLEVGDSTVDVSATVAYHRVAEQAARTQVALDLVDKLNNQDDVLALLGNVRADLGRGGRFAAGLEGYFDFVKSGAQQVTVGGSGTITQTPEWLRYPGGSAAHSFAAFASDELDLEHLFSGTPSPRPGRVKLLVSGRVGGHVLVVGQDDRVSRFLLNGQGGSPKRYADEFSIAAHTQTTLVYAGSLHVRYEFVPGAAVVAGFMTGVRPASLDDSARLDLGRPGLLLPSDKPLEAEAAYSGEAGFRLAYSRIELDVFYAVNRLTHPISLVQTKKGDCSSVSSGSCVDRYRFKDAAAWETLLSRRNDAWALFHSVETSFRLNLFGQVHVLGSLGFAYGDLVSWDDLSKSQPFSRVPPLWGKGALQYRKPRSMLTLLEGGARLAASQARLSEQDRFDVTICPLGPVDCRGTGGYVVTYLRAALRLSRQMYLSGQFENLAGETYRVHGSGIPGPGLGAHIALEGNL